MRMDAKEFFSQTRYLDQLIEEDMRELRNLRSTATLLRSPGFEQHYNPSKPTEAPFVKSLERVWDVEEQLKNSIHKLTTLKAQIMQAIETVPDREDRLLLKYRYLDNMTYEQIGALLHMDRSTAYRACERALTLVELPNDAICLCQN